MIKKNIQLLFVAILTVAFSQSNQPFLISPITLSLVADTKPTPVTMDLFARRDYTDQLTISPTTPSATLPPPTTPTPKVEGTASLRLAPPASNVNTSDPASVASYLQANIANDLRSDFSQFVTAKSDSCCASYNPTLLFNEDFERISVLTDVDYKLFKGRGAPNPGNYRIANSVPSLSPWGYHSCKNNSHLWINGINTNWSPFYRRIFLLSQEVEKGSYRLCFKMRNLPQATWDAKPFGVVLFSQDGVAIGVTYWYIDMAPANACSWKSLSSSRYSASAGNLTVSINLYNGNTQDGNDLVVDDISLIKLSPPVQQPTFGYDLVNFTGNSYGVRLNSKLTPAQCKDNFYIRTGSNPTFVLKFSNATIRTDNEYTFYGLQIKTPYEIGVKRICDCTEDAFWRVSFNLNDTKPAISTPAGVGVGTSAQIIGGIAVGGSGSGAGGVAGITLPKLVNQVAAINSFEETLTLNDFTKPAPTPPTTPQATGLSIQSESNAAFDG